MILGWVVNKSVDMGQAKPCPLLERMLSPPYTHSLLSDLLQAFLSQWWLIGWKLHDSSNLPSGPPLKIHKHKHTHKSAFRFSHHTPLPSGKRADRVRGPTQCTDSGKMFSLLWQHNSESHLLAYMGHLNRTAKWRTSMSLRAGEEIDIP